MMKVLLGAAGAVAAMVAVSSASAATYTTFDMGTLSSSNDFVHGGTNTALIDGSVTADELTAASTFDLLGVFHVAAPTSATAAGTLLQLKGPEGISNVSAAIYQRASSGDKGALVATLSSTCSACLQSPTAWVFMSPTAFSLDPNDYLFEVTGSKGAGNVLQYELAVTTVPLPGAALMFGAGLLVVGGLAARRKHGAAQAI